MVTLGDFVKDPITGFKGIAISRHSYLNGCDRISIQPPLDKNGKCPDTVTFDEPQLTILKKNKFLIGDRTTGGTDKYMDEGR